MPRYNLQAASNFSRSANFAFVEGRAKFKTSHHQYFTCKACWWVWFLGIETLTLSESSRAIWTHENFPLNI